EEEPGNVSYRRQLANSHQFRGTVLADLGKASEARAAYDAAARIYEPLLKESPDDVHLQLALANTLLNTGVLLSARADFEQLERLYGRMMELDRAAAKAAPDGTGVQAELSLGLEGQGIFSLNTGRAKQALGPIREVLTIRQKLAAAGGPNRLF